MTSGTVAEYCSSVIINYIVKNTSEMRYEFRKMLRRSSHISYYSNTSATHRILLGGDNETNDKKNSKKAATKRKAPICLVCEKTTYTLKTTDMHLLQTPGTFTLYKHKITNNFKH